MNVLLNKKGGPKPFPKLMISRGGNVVLMHSKDVGTLLHINNSNALGEGPPLLGVWKEWKMEHFTDYHGTVTLEN